MQSEKLKMGSQLGISIGRHSGCGKGELILPVMGPVQQLMGNLVPAQANNPHEKKNGSFYGRILREKLWLLEITYKRELQLG